MWLLQRIFAMIRMIMAISQTCLVLMVRSVAVAVQTFLHCRLLVAQLLQRLHDSIYDALDSAMDYIERVHDEIHKYNAVGRCVLCMNKLTADDDRLKDACAVCLTSMDVHTSRLTPCGHVFHGKCLKLCLRVLPHCPMCRYQLITGAIAH